MRVGLLERLDDIPAKEWDALGDPRYPFLRSDFLAALERGGSVGKRSGWQPFFVTLTDDRGLAAAAPGWLKTHSYGEFVFDFAWAQAYARHGLAYYPKLVVAAPFTPATGPRLLVRQGLDRSRVVPLLLAALEGAADERGLSSTHVLFPDEADRSIIAAREGWLMRRDCQFHWRNRGYACFEDFLAGFTAEKRKKARRERRRVVEGGITFRAVHGHEATRIEVLTAWELHRTTFRQRGSEPYLSAETFVAIARSMGGSLLFQFAMQGEEIVAVAVCFVGGDTLYGRYWGAAGDFHSLHFEACYHQGVEYCIAHGLSRFEPGTQGEHKVARGFEPTATHSAHRIADPRFARAIADYLRAEGAAVDEYAAGIRAHVPYRADLET
ncbi:MAG: GNAT family N-acetyltransferase [Gammaproteobacteria bacterium]|jgi:predicted N-acyltransferase